MTTQTGVNLIAVTLSIFFIFAFYSLGAAISKDSNNKQTISELEQQNNEEEAYFNKFKDLKIKL